ncbi:MAG: DnaD domain protein [Bacilli bacterium]|nr:DnaD domain protein [Bacilli bacterium]
MTNIVMPADIFVVVNRTILHDYDHKILTMLYQPIIGSISISLYLTLWSYLDKYEISSNTLTHHNLMRSMNINVDKIAEARESLEAIGLLKTYLKESEDTNSYVYELYSPLKISDFFKDPVLSTLLHDAVGSKEFTNIKEYFKVPKIDLKDYKDITVRFNDVFKTMNLIDIDDIEQIKRENRLGIAYEPTINLNNILSVIPDQVLNHRSVTNATKDLIYKLAMIYNYDDDMIEKVILSSIDESHKINIDELRKSAKRLYKFETGSSKVGLIYKNQPEYLRTKLNGMSKKDKKIYDFETMSTYEFLASKSNVERLTEEEADIVSMLIDTIGLTPGVANVLLDYVLKTSENRLVPSYVKSKALEWKRDNIKTVPDAMNKAIEEKKRKTVTKKVVKKDPVWLNNESDIDEATEEEEKAFIEKLKNME